MFLCKVLTYQNINTHVIALLLMKTFLLITNVISVCTFAMSNEENFQMERFNL